MHKLHGVGALAVF